MRSELPDGWQRLTCTCGTERFAAATFLRWRKSGGITTEPAGYFCLECHTMVDSAALIARAELKAKKQELKDLEEEIGEPLLHKPLVAAAGKGK